MGLVLPLGVRTVLTLQALPIRAGFRGGSRDDGLGRQDQPIWLMLWGYEKNKTTLNADRALSPNILAGTTSGD